MENKQLKIELREPSPEDYRRAAKKDKPKNEDHGEIKVSELPQEELGKLYKRAEDISEKEEDEKDFFQREKSVKPPKKGEIVKQPFPPPISLEKPEQLMKEEEEIMKELKVIRYQPEGKDFETIPSMVVTFNQPMVPLTGVDDIKKYPVPVKMKPVVEGEWRWVGTKTVKWKPSYRLPKSTDFEVTIPKGVKSELGCKLKKEVRFTFSTVTLSITKCVPESHSNYYYGPQFEVGEDGFVFLEFNQRINPKKIFKHLKVSGGGSRNQKIRPISTKEVKKRIDEGGIMKKKLRTLYDSYTRALENGKEGRYIWFGFSDPLALGKTFTINIDRGCPSEEGPRVTTSALTKRFTTYGEMKKTDHSPENDIVPNQSWTVTFSNNIELDDFDPDRDVMVKPPINRMKVVPSGRTLSISGQTKGKTTYTLTVNTSLLDVYGQKLRSVAKVKFSVGRARQSMSGFFNNQMIVHDMCMNDNPQFEVVSINLAKIRVCIFQVEPWEYHKCGIGPDYQWYSQQWGYNREKTLEQWVNCGKKVYDEVITVEKRPDELVETVIPLSPHLQNKMTNMYTGEKRSGQLFVYVEPDKKSWKKDEKFRYAPRIRTWVQVSSLAVDAYSSCGGETYAFCTQLTDGRPVDGVEFFYQGSLRRYFKEELQREKYEGGQMSVLGKKDGTAFLSKCMNNNALMIAKKGSDTCFVTNVRYVNRPGPRLLHYIKNDRNLYKPKETVSVKGIFRNMYFTNWERKLEIPKLKTEVKWICYDPRGSKLKEGKTEINEYGSFFMSVDLPDNINLGNGRIRFTFQGTSADHTFKIQEFRVPEFSASAKVDTGPYFMNGVAIVEGKAEYFSGGGLSGCDVNWKVNQSETNYYPPNFTFRGYTFNCSYKPLSDKPSPGSQPLHPPRPSIFGGFPGRGGRIPRAPRRPGLPSVAEALSPDALPPGTFKGNTDGSGEHKISVDFRENKDMVIKKPTRVSVDLNIQDINRQLMSSSTSFVVHPSKLYVGIKKNKYFARKGDALPMDFVVTDLDGVVVEDVEIELSIYNRYWDRVGYNWKEFETKVLETKIRSRKEPFQLDLRLAEGGTYHFVAKVVDRDGMANFSSTSLWVAGGKEKGGGSKVTQEVAKLIGSKKEFEVGDEAKILVSSPFSPAEGMMVVICNGFTRAQRFSVEEDSAVLTVPIRREYVPNVIVQVYLSGTSQRVDEHTGRPSMSSPKRPAFASGSLMLTIPPKMQKLKVNVEPDRKIMKPGESGEVKIQVTGEDENLYDESSKERTAVSLIIVDEAVLSLTGYELPHPISSFHPSNTTTVSPCFFRNSVVMKNWNSIRVEAPEKIIENCGILLQEQCCCKCCDCCTRRCCPSAPGRGRGRGCSKRFGKIGGRPPPCPSAFSAGPPPPQGASPQCQCLGGMPPIPEEEEEQSVIEVRSDFKPLACFIHDTQLDKNGEAVIKFTLPDNLTKYRVWVLAHSEKNTDMFGLGESAIQAQLPVAIRPSLPRFLNYGDRCEFTVVIQNQTLNTVQVKVAVRMTNLRLLDESKAGILVEIPYEKRAELRFPVRTHKCGTGRFQVIGAVVGTKFADAIEKDLPIFTPSTSEAFATYGEVDGDGAVIQSVVPPESVYNQFGGLTITTSSTALQSLTDSFLYLYGYKFDCIEQISSRMLSINALSNFLYEFNVPKMPSKRDIRKVIEDGFKKIRGSMRTDGAIGFWSLTSRVNIYLSIYVAHNLIRCKENGFDDVDTTLLNRSKNFCQNVDAYIRSYCIWYGEYTKASLRAKALYVLTIYALNGELSGHEKDKLAKRAEGLYKKKEKYFSHEGKVWLMFCVFVCSREQGKHPIVTEILKWLMNNVEETPETAHFVTSYGDDGKLVMLHSNRRTDGVVLEALCHVDPQNYLIPKIVKGLLAHRKKGRWSSTQENVYILMALKKYFEVFENVVPDFLCRVWLGEGYAGEVKFKGREVDFKAIEIPMNALVEDDDEKIEVEKKDLCILKQGPGRLYYRLGMDYAPKSHDLKPVDYGFQVERSYEHVTRPDHVKKLENGVWQFTAGELVRVKLRLTNVSRRFHVALVDFIPAGCEVLNPELKGTQKIPGSAQSEMTSYSNASPYRWCWWYAFRRWYEHINLRDERVEAFSSYLYCGVHEYEYVMRATSLGQFVVPPAKAEEMYSPELFGRSASEKVIIAE